MRIEKSQSRVTGKVATIECEKVGDTVSVHCGYVSCVVGDLSPTGVTGNENLPLNIKGNWVKEQLVIAS